MSAASGDERHKALSTAAEYWSKQTAQPRNRLSWGNFRTIRYHMSQRIVGRPVFSLSMALIERAKACYGVDTPFARGVSIGCGAGGKEIGLTVAGVVSQWDCFEISSTRVAAGREQARAKGVLDRIRFRQEDAFEANCPQYDLVYWSASLHHMMDIQQAVQWSLDHLRPGGLFLMDEFVGPNRFQWTDEMLSVSTAVRECLDDRHLIIPEAPSERFPRVMSRPNPQSIIDADPTESVASEAILGAVLEFMPDAEIYPLGGVIYHVALSGILTNFTEQDEPLLKSLLLLDGELADRGLNVLAGATCRKG